MTVTWKEGDHFTVTINGRDYDTHIIKGVQRFVGNPIVTAFVDASYRSDATFDLNDISYEPGNPYTLDELIEFSTLHQYSVSGMCDLSFMDGVEVINPIWED